MFLEIDVIFFELVTGYNLKKNACDVMAPMHNLTKGNGQIIQFTIVWNPIQYGITKIQNCF